MLYDITRLEVVTGERDPAINKYHIWLSDNKIKYNYGWRSADDPRCADFYLKFNDLEDMMAFKLIFRNDYNS